MDYFKLYKQLILTRAQEKIKFKTHIHHIIPRYLGGSNKKDNLVNLKIKDHAFAHWILYKLLRNNEDKVAYKMLLGKKSEAEKLRIQLALIAYPPEKRKEYWKQNNPSFNKECLKKSKETRLHRYDGNFFSEEGASSIRKLCNSGSQKSQEAKSKIRQSLKLFMKTLTKEERSKIYGRNGPQNGNFGKKRPNELAGNFGKSKGEYIATSREGEVIKFASLEKAMAYGFDEGVLKRNKNTNVPIKRGKWAGYIISYKENENYGKDYNKNNAF